jgi:hypothetical protein
MNVQEKIQAHKRTLLTLTGTLAVASGAFASTAAACPAFGVASAIAGRALPAVETRGTYRRVHPPRKVLRGEKIPEGRMLVNTAGVASRLGVLVRVDESFHAVNAKGFRVGGRPLDS